jgi:response regulator RpfG family c-di-GMP phosphodiesterase
LFDALPPDRPYRKAMTDSAAYRMMRDEATSGWREPALVDAFVELHREEIRERAAS